MARKLPWTADGSPVPKKARTGDQTSSPVKEDASTVAEVNANAPALCSTAPESTPQLRRKRANARSPSSSPIRDLLQPTTEIEPMHPTPPFPDDKYILVEDEFEAVAKSFTAHLHAAEYDRLRRKAKENPPTRRKEIPQTSSTGGLMPVVTTLGLKQKEVRAQQNQALEEVLGRGSRATDLDHGETETVEDKIDDPWAGTSLAGLMGNGRQEKRSLVGLDRLSSSTRAARGFKKGNGETDAEERAKRKKKNRFDVFGVVLDDDDDVQPGRQAKPDGDGDSTTHSNYLKDHRAVDPIRSKKPSALDDQRADDVTDTHPRPPSPQSKPSKVNRRPTQPRRSWVDDLDDFDDDNESGPSSSARQPTADAMRAPVSGRSERDKKRDRRARLDEVPVFIM